MALVSITARLRIGETNREDQIWIATLATLSEADEHGYQCCLQPPALPLPSHLSLVEQSFGYAGDLLLLSPSIHGIEMLVETSESFASEYGVTFNAKKTECICFGKNAFPLQSQVLTLTCATTSDRTRLVALIYT